MAAAEISGLGETGEGVGLVFPKFFLAPSGIIPDPPFSISQGSVPAGHGYSYKYIKTSEKAKAIIFRKLTSSERLVTMRDSGFSFSSCSSAYLNNSD